ncbi:hypothetical protein NDU88_001988 [Pleurodeles waltl]|uniref:Vitellogenin domain-containing protein n=1 Tax=Pleurodeles waltl TaxID=8319 RepID=A0AAV7M2P7_PLEWA|nr:hypothetical protein NDU88_001988 [Pleurodeles waltl]
MGQRAFILLCAVAGALGSKAEDSGQKATCVAECSESSMSRYQKGYSYTYKYSTTTSTFLQGTSYEKSGIMIESLVIIKAMGRCHLVLELQDVQLKTTLRSKQDPMRELQDLRISLEKNPLEFTFCDGNIPLICPPTSEQTWALNIKRGILSLLQSSYTSSTHGPVEEVDVLGKCPTKYHLRGSVLWKTKDLNLCSQRSSSFSFLRSVPLPHKASQQHILESKLECMQSFKDGILSETLCTESHLATPFSRKGNGATTLTESMLKLITVDSKMVHTGDSKDLFMSSLLYEKEGIVSKSQGEEVMETVRKLCIAQSMNFATADLFISLVFELRLLTTDALMALWQRSSFKCRDNWQPLVDALPSCGTEACVLLMKDVLLSKDIEEEKIDSFLWSLAFVPEPTAIMIGSLTPLLESPEATQNVYLGITALLHNFCSTTSDCDRVPEVQGLIRIFQGHLGENCNVNQAEKINKMQLYLKAIGNAGLAAVLLTPVLSSCALQESNPTIIRLAAIEAFRRIPCSAERKALFQLYQAPSEDTEVRIAAYYTLMMCPNEELFKIVQQVLSVEKSSQVGSFVWSHLSQLFESDDPMKQQIRDSLPQEILSKEFDWETWKYSSYSDVTFRSETGGANREGSLVFTSSSFIPRSAMANLTVHAMGHAINLLELGIRLENVEDLTQRFLGEHAAALMDIFNFAKKNEDNPSKANSPIDPATKAKQEKRTVKRQSHGDHHVTKPDKSKSKKGKNSCSSGKYNRINELQQKFMRGLGNRKELNCGLSMKIFGHELSFLDCDDVKHELKHYSLSVAELAVKLLKGQEVQFSKRMSLATEELTFPSISGIPIQLSLNMSGMANLKIKGNMDFKHRSNFLINGYVKPSALLQISAQMGTVGAMGKAGLKWITGIRTSTSLDGGIQVKQGRELKVFLNTPEDSMEFIDFSSQLYLVTYAGTDKLQNPKDRRETKLCTSEDVSKLFGWQLCSEMSYSDTSSDIPFPLSGPVKASVTLKKQDKSLHQYLLEAAYNYISQKNSWIPHEAALHFFLGTPKSVLKRDVGIDLSFNAPQRKFLIKFIHPKKKMHVEGKLEASRNARIGHLELIVDDKDIYYIRGITDLHTVSGDHRYTVQLEVKLSKYGSPIIFSGNITKQLGRKMTIVVALNNLLKDTAFLSGHLERKVDDKLKQYSVDGEAYLPGVFGTHTIGLLQHRDNTWSNALRIKYGLLGDAKNLRYECATVQKITFETNSVERYMFDFEHELHCNQLPFFSHKVLLKHAENVSHLHSQLEVSYGKHWDEINNRRKLLISQTFRNDSTSSLANYIMEFILQIPEKLVNYRTLLQHTHNLQGHSESNTHFKVQFNNRMPFVAGLQWKDNSKNQLSKWEGAFNMDTPWLYLYTALKVHQLQWFSYVYTAELTAGKALSIKNLVMEMFCKDKGNEKEGKVHIYTPTATFLKASTVHYIEKNAFRSYSEIMSLWNPLLKNEIHLENNDRAKYLRFKVKTSKQEFNFTADYVNSEKPKKANMLAKALWTDHKSLPIVLQLDGEIEELKREKMLYQKRGTLHFRHPFKLAIPQSFFLQETFTVDKKKKHYFLETKVVTNGKEEAVQTLLFGYQPENPHVCASLAHPYTNRVFPKNIDICASVRSHRTSNLELEASVKMNKKDVVGFVGIYQNKSSDRDAWYLFRMNMSHSFQVRFPQDLVFDGELFSKHIKPEDFNCALRGKLLINRNDTSQFNLQMNGSSNAIGFYSRFTHPYQSQIPQNIQALAMGKKYGEKGVNGTLTLSVGGKSLAHFEVDVSSERMKNTRMISLSALLHQSILKEPHHANLRLVGKASPSRISMSSEIHLNQSTFQMDLSGTKEEKVGQVLSMTGQIQHNVDDLKTIPKFISLAGSLKHKNDINEGNLRFLMNQAQYGVYLKNRNIFGNTSLHNINVIVTQNGSQLLPTEAKFKGQMEFTEQLRKGEACFQMDEKSLCVDISNNIDPEHRGVTGKLTHNIIFLINAGLPMEGAVVVAYDHISTNRTVTMGLQSGSDHINMTIGVERLFIEPPQSQITARLLHNLEELKKHGVPFSAEGVCYYENSSKKEIVGVKVEVDQERFRGEVQKKNIGSSTEISLLLHHDMASLMDTVPSTLQVICSGEAISNQLSGHCSGEFSSKAFEVYGTVSKFSHQHCTILRLNYSGESLRLQGCQSNKNGYELTGVLTNSFKYLLHLKLPQNIQAKAVTRRKMEKRLSTFNLTVDNCDVHTEFEVSTTPHLRWNGFVFCKPSDRIFGKHLARSKGVVRLGERDFEADVRASYNRLILWLAVKTKFKDNYVANLKWHHEFRGPHKHKNRQFALTLWGEAKKNLIVGTMLLEKHGNYFNTSGALLLLNNRVGVKCTLDHKWEHLGKLLVPENMLIDGLMELSKYSIGTSLNFVAGGKPVRVELRTAWGTKIELEMLLSHAVPEWMHAGISAHNRFHGVTLFGKRNDLSMEFMSGACKVSGLGHLERKPHLKWNLVVHNHCPSLKTLVPLRFSLNGSMLAKSCMVTFLGHVSADDDTGAHLNLLAECGLKNRMEFAFKHSFRQLQTLGIAKENKVRISASKDDKFKAMLNITLGRCSLKVHGESRTENNHTDAANSSWLALISNKCTTLETMGFPHKIVTEGSFYANTCNLNMNTTLQLDGKAVALHLESSCDQQYTVYGSLNHSMPKLSKIGVSSENAILLSAGKGSTHEGVILLQAGSCKISARANFEPKNKTEWMLETESDCQLLKNFRIPAHTQINGSVQMEGCQAELLCTLKMDGHPAYLNVSTSCQPQASLDVVFRHDLPQLKEIPGRSALSLRVGKQPKQSVAVELKSGNCEFHVTGDIQFENKMQWAMLLENKCKFIQDLGTPTKIDGSGYLMINKVNLDSQALVIIDENTLQGLLILKATDKKQELDALFTHNIQTAIDAGIPARTLVDVTSEKNGDRYKRFIQLSVDSNQITEELSFIQKVDHVLLNYKLTHNLEALKALLIEDRIDVQAALDLKETKNLSMSVQYGSRLIIVGTAIKGTKTSTDLTWNFHHNWPWLLQSGISTSIQATIDTKWTDPATECILHITAGQSSITYTVNYYCSQRRKEMTFNSVHNIQNLLVSGYPKAINATAVLQRLGNKAQTILGLHFDDQWLVAEFDVNADLLLNDTLELNTEVKHSTPVISYLGIPRSVQMTLYRTVNETDLEISLAINCATNTSLMANVHAKDQQQRKELKIEVHQNVPFLMNYVPGTAALSTKVNYSKTDSEGKLSIQLEEDHFQVSTKFFVEGPNYTKILQLVHSMPQLIFLPRQLEVMTALVKLNRTHLLRHVTSSQGKEIKLLAAYRGLFPKLAGSHEIKAEAFQTLFSSFPWQSKFNIYAEHLTHSHRDEITIGWNGRNQVGISSSLKIGKERLECRASLTHPFNIALKQLEVTSLSEKRGNKYSQQAQLAWDGGLPIDFKFTLNNKSKNNTTSWDACLTFLSGQLQKILHFGDVLACGSVEQSSDSFNETLDLNWENKRILQSLLFKRNGPLKPDVIQAEATLENLFLTSCSKEHILARMETNYVDSLEHYTSLGVCELPNVIVSGKHHLDKGEHLLQSQTRLYLSTNEKDDLSFTVALKNNGSTKAKNYMANLELKASERVHMAVMGRYTTSPTRGRILLEGNVDEKEKVRFAVSKDKDCLQYSVEHITGQAEDNGLELSACVDGNKLAALETYLTLNGKRQERLWHIAIAAVNQSVILTAHGCGNAVVKVESILSGIGSQLKTSILDKIHAFDEFILEFRKIFRPVDFLQELTSWPLKASLQVAGILQHGAKAAGQVWKQSGVRQILWHDLPLYLEKIQDIVQQMQYELQKPLETLKEAYYDVMLTPLEEVWREKTDEYMKKIETFLPSIVKDVRLMEPIHGVLTAVKSALDMGIQYLLKWADTKLSRTVSKIRQPLSDLYNFSKSSCYLILKLPVLPKSHYPVDLANITKYLIEEKLMKNTRDFYNINPMAEYYRFKHRMMESPFEYHSLLIGNKYFVTFDGRVYEMGSKCSFLLAKDFLHDSFTIILNQENAGMRSLLVEMNHTTITIYPGLAIEENCHRIDMPFEKNGISIRKEATGIEVSNQKGVSLVCDHHEICSLTLHGWHHGTSAGLFGTNDNEAGNEFMLPDHSFTDNVQEFTKSWQVDSQCTHTPKKLKMCSVAAHQKTCKSFFKEGYSTLKNCFRVVDPVPFYDICLQDTCESNELKSVCKLVAAFVHLCNRNHVPLEIPLQCV